MQLYGYKSACIKVGGPDHEHICWCYDCADSDDENRGYRKRNRKRARRWAKEDIKKQLKI